MVMAEIYTNCGLYDETLDEIEHALSQETIVTVNQILTLKPWLRPLHNLPLPRFKALIEKYGTNDGL